MCSDFSKSWLEVEKREKHEWVSSQQVFSTLTSLLDTFRPLWLLPTCVSKSCLQCVRKTSRKSTAPGDRTPGVPHWQKKKADAHSGEEPGPAWNGVASGSSSGTSRVEGRGLVTSSSQVLLDHHCSLWALADVRQGSQATVELLENSSDSRGPEVLKEKEAGGREASLVTWTCPYKSLVQSRRQERMIQEANG